MDRSVYVRNVTFEDAGAVHHGNAGHADVVLDSHGLAGENSALRTGYVATPVPSPQWVVFRLGSRPWGPRVFDRQAGSGKLVQPGIRVQDGLAQLNVGLHIGRGWVQVVRACLQSF